MIINLVMFQLFLLLSAHRKIRAKHNPELLGIEQTTAPVTPMKSKRAQKVNFKAIDSWSNPTETVGATNPFFLFC